MKLFRELIIILGIYLAGVFISGIFKLSIPGNVLGMLILLLLLQTGIIKLKSIENAAAFFLDNLSFFFIPAGVGILSTFGVIKDIWIKLLVICILTTIITMVCTGKIVQLLSKMKKQEEGVDKSGSYNK